MIKKVYYTDTDYMVYVDNMLVAHIVGGQNVL